MDFALPESALAVQEGVGRVAAKFDLAYWDRCDAEHVWPEELWQDLAGAGWIGLAIPEEYGGGGQGLLELVVATECLAASGAGGVASLLYVLTPGFGGLTVARHGTAEQKAELLPGMATGEIESCFAITEPDAGSNAFAMKTFARAEGSDFVVNGRKIWTSGAARSQWMLLVCRTAMPVDNVRSSSGFTILLIDVHEALASGSLTLTPVPKMGTNVVPSYMVYLDDVHVPTSRVLGEVDRGFTVLWDILNPERALVAAGAVGSADLALRLACDYANQREVFDRPIGANQGVAFPLAHVKAQTELARLMTYKAAWLYDNDLPSGTESNVAKYTAANACFDAADRAFQTYGGMAYATEYPIARIFRDARILRTIPVSEELILSHIATQSLGLPRSY
jgi:acyl-CoA dehydrogenase